MDQLKVDITNKLYEKVFPHLKNDQISLFLIGKHIKDPTSLRRKIKDTFENSKYIGKKFIIYYPEEIFSDLLYNAQIDLLTLENLLAESVHAVVICLESPGSIAELGAFANNNKLNKKLVVLIEKGHKKDRSFIRKGPIKLLESSNDSHVLWYNKREPIQEIAKRTRYAIYKISIAAKITRNLQNPIIAEDFLLMVICTLGSASASELIKFIKNIEKINPQEAATVCYGALNALFKRKALFLQNNQYMLTYAGHQMIIDSLPQKNKTSFIDTLDSLRIQFLNKELRKCK